MAAETPEALHAALEDAFRRADPDALALAYEPDAVLVVPPDGRLARGRDEIRAAMAPVLAGRPRLTSVVVKTVRGDELALTHARWELSTTDADGARSTMRGRGTLVSRRGPDGTWRIVLDDPLSPLAE